MNINMIVAISEKRPQGHACGYNVIGNGDKLPWNIPNDLTYFKEKTLHKTIVMGRKTFESIGRVLPNRKTIILTRQKDYKYNDPSVFVYNKIEDIFKDFANEELWVVGGLEVYKLFYPYTQKLYVTRVYKKVDGDSFFIQYDNDFDVEHFSPKLEQNGYEYQFFHYQRKVITKEKS